MSLLANPAGAQSTAEESYRSFVRSISTRAVERPHDDGTRRWEARLGKASDVQAIGAALDATIHALANASRKDQPQAVQLTERLELLRKQLAMARALDLDPGELLRVTLQMRQDGGGWDSVVWGDRAYPVVSGDVTLHFRVSQGALPQGETDPIALACPEARYSPWVETDIARDPDPWVNYLEEARRYVRAALRTAHLPSLPEALIVLDPPDAAFSRPVELASSRRSFAIRRLSVKDWAEQTPTPSDSPERRRAFLEAWRELQQTSYAREYRGNCALIAQRLLVDTLGSIVPVIRNAQRESLLGPWVRPVIQHTLPLRRSPSPTSDVLATVKRGEAVESVAGFVILPGTTRVELADWLQIRTDAGQVGWVPRELELPWQGPTRTGVLTLTVFGTQGPESLDEQIAKVDEQASLWRQSSLEVKRLRGERAEESAKRARDSLDYFCQVKARLENEIGRPGVADTAGQMKTRRLSSGEDATGVAELFKETWNNPSCGAR